MAKKINKTVCLPRVRVVAGNEIALGPGKVDLLEEIDRSGSISKAARDLGLSYRRAWTLVDTMNKNFKSSLVECSAGGKKGGGAHLTPLGEKIAKTYRSMESKAKKAMLVDWKIIQRSLKSSN